MGGSDQNHNKKKKCKKAKWLSEQALQIAEKRREAKGKGENGIYIHLNAEFQRIARRDNDIFIEPLVCPALGCLAYQRFPIYLR